VAAAISDVLEGYRAAMMEEELASCSARWENSAKKYAERRARQEKERMDAQASLQKAAADAAAKDEIVLSDSSDELGSKKAGSSSALEGGIQGAADSERAAAVLQDKGNRPVATRAAAAKKSSAVEVKDPLSEGFEKRFRDAERAATLWTEKSQRKATAKEAFDPHCTLAEEAALALPIPKPKLSAPAVDEEALWEGMRADEEEWQAVAGWECEEESFTQCDDAPKRWGDNDTNAQQLQWGDRERENARLVDSLSSSSEDEGRVPVLPRCRAGRVATTQPTEEPSSLGDEAAVMSPTRGKSKATAAAANSKKPAAGSSKKPAAAKEQRAAKAPAEPFVPPRPKGTVEPVSEASSSKQPTSMSSESRGSPPKSKNDREAKPAIDDKDAEIARLRDENARLKAAATKSAALVNDQLVEEQIFQEGQAKVRMKSKKVLASRTAENRNKPPTSAPAKSTAAPALAFVPPLPKGK